MVKEIYEKIIDYLFEREENWYIRHLKDVKIKKENIKSLLRGVLNIIENAQIDLSEIMRLKMKNDKSSTVPIFSLVEKRIEELEREINNTENYYLNGVHEKIQNNLNALKEAYEEISKVQIKLAALKAEKMNLETYLSDK